MRTLLKCLFFFFSAIVLFASCSRPTAYFQPSAREHFNATPVTETSIGAVATSAPVSPVLSTVNTSTQQLVQADIALEQVDAMVRNDSKLAASKTVQKRLNRIRTYLASNSARAAMTPGMTNAPKKMNLMERMMLKKIDKKISRQLAPASPEKAMAIKGILAIGAILVLAGIILLLLTTGTGATIGVVSILGGLVLLLIGLL
ncbi:hypothetical protein [Spirosoma validum]|uniref:Uncharacterized protein n=1 Tax=Spirosoma validum TaxID=2771355 RepID=A0A927AZU8_9BACT|nr:hypothetical protein [Spirosoma validum]MBD2752791.1 hypothetical protein [Spirosoma validum]